MSQAGAEVRWVPLESNPQVMTKYMHSLGMSQEWLFTDVYGLDDDLLMMIPQPVVALVLLFPYDDKYKAFAKSEEEKIDKEGQTVSDGIYYMKQTIRNACGTIGVLHAVLNTRDTVTQKGILKSFYEQTKELTPEERGKTLESNESISQAHEESAHEGQTEAPSPEESVCPHFITFVEKDKCVYELDGCKKYPINHGPVQESFVKSAASVCKKFMERDPSEVHFTIMALSKDN